MIGQSSINFIRQVEGVRYEMYKDSAGKPTIGVGHLIRPGETDLLHGKIDDTKVNALLTNDLRIAADSVSHLVHVPLKQSQVDAILSFTFNLGGGALQNSTLLTNINTGKPVLEHNFTDWDKEHKDGKLIEVEGLKQRREKEYKLFIS